MTAPASIHAPITGDCPSHWLDRVCQPQTETVSQQLLSAALSARLSAVLDLYDDFRMALKRFQSKRGPRPKAALMAVLRLLDEIQPVELSFLLNGLKRLDALCPTTQTVEQLKSLGEVFNLIHPAARTAVESLLVEIDRLESQERSEYKECFLRLRKDEIARVAPAVYEELKRLEEVQVNGRIAKLNVMRFLPVYIRYLLAMDSSDPDEATDLFAQIGQSATHNVSLFALHLKAHEMDELTKKLTALRKRNLMSYQQLSLSDDAQKAFKLESEILSVLSSLALESRLAAQRALQIFESAESTVDEMMALTELRKLSPELAAKAKRWRLINEPIRRNRVAGQQLEKLQRTLSFLGAGFDPPVFFRLIDKGEYERQGETTCESPVLEVELLSRRNCMAVAFELEIP